MELQAKIKGMHCAACSSRIERVVGGLAGVEQASVNLATETIALRWDETILSLADIAERINDLGFELVEAEEQSARVELAITGMHCAACSSRIERVVAGLAGVKSCTVNLAAETCQLQYVPGQVTVRAVSETIAQLGFEARLQEPPTQQQRLQQDEQRRGQLASQGQRLVPTFLLALAIMVVSMGPMLGLPLPTSIQPSSSPLLHGLLQLLLLLPVLWLGRHFYQLGLPALWRRQPTMDSLIAVGTGAALVYSCWNVVEIALGVEPVAKAHDLYFESAAMLIALVSLGKYLEARAKVKTGEAISQLMELAPAEALLLKDGEQQLIPVQEILQGDHLLVRQGGRVPVDGVVLSGSSRVDEAMLTGESEPVRKEQGDQLFGGTLNRHGALTMEAVKVGQDTMLARIISLVQEAQGSKAPIANLADRLSLYFVPAVMAIAVLAGLAWYVVGDASFTFSLRIFIAVLVIACPCAMGLATPTSIMVGTGRGAQLGVLLKNGEVLERAGQVHTIVFDKTGTLTHGKPSLSDYVACPGSMERQELLRLVATAESRSEHPLAEALLQAASDEGVAPVELRNFVSLPGQGVEAEVGPGLQVLVGNHGLLASRQVQGLDTTVEQQAEQLARDGKTALFVAVDGRLQAVLGVADQLKAETAATVAALTAMGLELIMLTGDNQRTAQAVARQAGLEQVVAQVLPEQKDAQVVRLREQGKVVAMVGDGINDAPALARADVGIAMGTGIDVAIESADVVLMKGDLRGVLAVISLSRATMKNIRQNLFWAFAYNVVGIPVAAGLLYIFGGPTLNPMIAGAAMALSSVSVVSNALRLRFFQPPMDR